MKKRNWVFKLNTALILMVAGACAFAAPNNLYANNTHDAGTSAAQNLLSGSNAVNLTSNTPNLMSDNSNNLKADPDQAGDTEKPGGVYADNPNDYSIKYLNMLFGHVGNTLHGGVSGQTIGHLFYIFNQGILIACGIWVLLTLVRILGKLIDGNVQEVSKEGKAFLSICLGIVLVIPSPKTGYSTIQDIIMKVVVQGVKLANGIWDYQVDQFQRHSHVFDNPPQQSPWINNGGEDDPEYTYSSIMLTTIPAKINGSLYNMLSKEMNYYQSEIDCEQGGCGDDPHPLINDTLPPAPGALGSVAINTNYNAASTGDPVVFSANLADITFTRKTSDQPFASNLISAANTLEGTAKSLVCESTSHPDNADSKLCQGMPKPNYANSANLLIGISTSLAESARDYYSLQRIKNEKAEDTDHTSMNCMARWQEADEMKKEYAPGAMEEYKKELEDWSNKYTDMDDAWKNIENNETYKKYHGDAYQKAYQAEDCHSGNWGWAGGPLAGFIGLGADVACQRNSRDYMGVGDVGAWGMEDTGSDLSDPANSEANRLATCKSSLKNGTTNGWPSGNVGEAMYPDATDEQLTSLCENFGSILYQIWHNDSPFHAGLSQAEKDALLKEIPDPADLPTGDKPTPPTPLPPDSSKFDQIKSCTDVLALKMKSSGWIMAGAYYWLIAHQDQKMASLASNKKKTFDEYSVGHKMFAALSALVFSGSSSDDDGSGGSGDYTPDNPSIKKLEKQVEDNSAEQFRDTGADMGQIDVNDPTSNGITAQLSWAANAFHSIIAGESENVKTFSGNNGKSASENQADGIGTKSGNSGIKNFSLKNPGIMGELYGVQGSLFPQMINQVYFLQKFILNVAQQLNNPNIDPQSIIASIGIGMIYQGGYASLGYLHMMISLVITILISMVILAVALMVPFAGGSIVMVGSTGLALLVSFVKIMGGMLKKIGVTFMAMGAIMAFYVPIYPWIVFTFAAVGWFIAVIEAMAAGPLICLGMTNPQGHELASSLKQSVMLLLSVFIRPALMIIAFIMSMILARVLLFYMIQGFLMLLGTLFDGNSSDYCKYIFNTGGTAQTNPDNGGISMSTKCDGKVGTNVNLWNSLFNLSSHSADIGNAQYAHTISMDNGDGSTGQAADLSHNLLKADTPVAYRPKMGLDGRPDAKGYEGVFQFIMMMLSMPIMLGVLTYMTYKIINHAYSLVFLVPENVLKWIGAQSAGDTRNMMQSAEGSKDMASRGAKSGAKGGQKAMDAGEQSTSALGKAGGSLGAKAAGKGGAALAKGKKQ